jgi:cytoskeletal protein CcmA (bactofilin family)
VVHEGARVLGNIEAAALVVAGKVEAGLLKADKVELRATAVVEGAIQAQMIVIADGAFYKGDIEGTGAGSAPPLLRDRRHYEPDPSRER